MKATTVIVMLLFTLHVFAQPTTAPPTESFLNGELIYTPPDGWKLDGKSNDGRRARYSHTDPGGQAEFVVVPQEGVIGDTYAAKLGEKLCQKLHDGIVAQKMKLLDPPKIEKDDRFFLRIHTRYSKGSEISEQIAIYRVIGKDLVSVVTTAFTDTSDATKAMFADSDKLLVSVKSANGHDVASAHAPAKTAMKPATRPTALPNAKIVFNGPAGWSEETNDNTSGIVANYKDPQQGFNMIAISVRPLPPEAKKDPKVAAALVDEIVKGEKAQFKFDNASPVGDTEVVKDNRFLKKERTRYETKDARIQVTSRQKRVGDAVVSVTMASVEATAVDVDRLADEVAMSLRPIK